MSILGPLLFLIHVNDLPYNLLPNLNLFAEDKQCYTAFNQYFL